MLSVEDVRAGYRGVEVLKGVSIEVREGEFVALVGSNGAGKTTLLRAISGILPLSSGVVRFQGGRIDGMPPYAIAPLGLVQVPEGRSLFPNMTVLENLLIGGQAGGDWADLRQRIEHVFKIFPRVEERQRQLAGTLSGGEQQMVAIARGLMARPKLLMLDEPSLGLAPLVVREVFESLKRLNEEGITILLVEQNVRQSLSISDSAYILENGQIVGSGRSENLVDQEAIREAYLGR